MIKSMALGGICNEKKDGGPRDWGGEGLGKIVQRKRYSFSSVGWWSKYIDFCP